MSYVNRILRSTFVRISTFSSKRDVNLSIKDACQLPDNLRLCSARLYCTGVLSEPTPSNVEKQYPQKIVKIAEEITKLTLIEVNDLNSLLKKTLNIGDMPMMAHGVMPGAIAPSPAQDDEEEVKAVKTSFTVKLIKFNPDKKIALIKEMRNIIEGMNLVQAKKFVENVPQVIKGNISKDEAESLQKTIEAAGGECEID